MGHNVVVLSGGLGNQLFQIAFGLDLAKKTGFETRYDFSEYRRRPDYLGVLDFNWSVPLNAPHRLVKFFPSPRGKFSYLGRILRFITSPRKLIFEPNLENSPNASPNMPAWFFGYWQTNVTSPEVLETIRSAVLGNSGRGPAGRVAVHVRRGDMVGKTDELQLSYYIEAYALLLEKSGLPKGTEVDVFSDDPDWCQKNLPFPTGVFHRQSKASEDIAKFATYDHQILSASTFSWWAARLRPNNSGVVVAPLPFALAAPNLISNESWTSVKR